MSANRETDIQSLYSCLYTGLQYESVYHNISKACEYYADARKIFCDIYGETNQLCDFISQYDYIAAVQRQDYRKAILMLADAGNLLCNFSQKDVVDDITQWILDDKNDFLKQISAKTWEVYNYFDCDMPMDTVAAQLVYSMGDVTEAFNLSILDPVGLPHRFQYLIDDFLNSITDISPERIKSTANIVSFVRENKNKNIADMRSEDKERMTKEILSCMENYASGLNPNSGFSAFAKNRMINTSFTASQGILNLNDANAADEILKKFLNQQDTIIDLVDRLRIQLLECRIVYRKSDLQKARKLLDDIKEQELNLLMQVFFMKDEAQKIQYLNGLSYILTSTIHTCLMVQGNLDAYSFLLRNRTITADYSSLQLTSPEADSLVIKHLRTGSKLEELHKWFDTASKGFFDLQARDICRKLSQTQAVLEFTTITDECDHEYYLVFIAVCNKVSALRLGKRFELDGFLDQLYNYMQEYSKSRHSACPIRELTAYRFIYEKILNPIEEILSSTIRELYIVPDGHFYKIPFELLPSFYWYDRYLEDDYKITYLNTGRELAEEKRENKLEKFTVIGAPDFCNTYADLPASLHEVSTIARLLNTAPYTGQDATADHLKSPAGIVHISTHSYQIGQEGKTDDPMQKTGLVFAEGQLLSAREISHLDLSKTDLVVLSVCSGNGGEMICNKVGSWLRRAFINAGARHIMLNLWKADDNATALFMEYFYTQHVKNHQSIRKSLILSRRYLRDSSAETIRNGPYYHPDMDAVLSMYADTDKPFSHPYYWAGFIQIGN